MTPERYDIFILIAVAWSAAVGKLSHAFKNNTLRVFATTSEIDVNLNKVIESNSIAQNRQFDFFIIISQ